MAAPDLSRSGTGLGPARTDLNAGCWQNCLPHTANLTVTQICEPQYARGLRTFYATVRFEIREIPRTSQHPSATVALRRLSRGLLLLFRLGQSACPLRSRRYDEHSHLLERGLVAHVAVAGGHLSQSPPPWWRALLSTDIPIRRLESSAVPCSDRPHHGRQRSAGLSLCQAPDWIQGGGRFGGLALVLPRPHGGSVLSPLEHIRRCLLFLLLCRVWLLLENSDQGRITRTMANGDFLVLKS